MDGGKGELLDRTAEKRCLVAISNRPKWSLGQSEVCGQRGACCT
jgi:hypothetical protein